MTARIELRYSGDGNNWSNWKERESGETGAFMTPLVWRRLGRARHRIWELRDTSDVAQDILAASLYVESE